MSFADPQSLTISGVTTSLPKTSSRVNGSTYQSADGLLKMTADNAYGRRNRRVLRVDFTKISPDQFVPAQNVKLSMSNYVVFDAPPAGFTNAEILANYVGFKTAFAATSDLLISKLLGGES